MAREIKPMSLDRFKINWILNEELAVGTAPKTTTHVEKLKKEGIKSILSLCSEKEHKSNIPLSILFHHERYVLPDHKTGRIPTIEELNEVLKIIKKKLIHGPIYIHCVAAVERSPLVCMAWLIREHNLNIQQALDYVMQVNSGTNPLPKQLKLLSEL